MTSRYVVFNHGMDSTPWGVKIAALADVARAEGYTAESVDYRGVNDPRQRISMLVDACKPLQGDLVLVGSSLGAYVAAASAALLHARGLFLMAPAFYMEGLPDLRPGAVDCPIAVVHGWRDEVVPVENAIRFAREYRATLHILDSDHRLHDKVRVIKYLFEYFLVHLDLPKTHLV